MTRFPRLTIRGGLVAIAGIAIFLGGVNWLRAYERVVSARRDYIRALVLYDEGRTSCVELASRSRSLMDAECSLTFSKQGRITCLEAHLHRLERIRDEEDRQSLQLVESRGEGSGPSDRRTLEAGLREARLILERSQ